MNKGIYDTAAKRLGMDTSAVESAYKAFWKFIKNKIEELPLKEDLTEEEFSKLRTNFSIPYLGKLSCTYSRYKNIKDLYNGNKKD